MQQGNYRGQTALFFACECDPEDMERFAKQIARDPREHVPKDRQPREIVRLLLEQGARVNQADSTTAHSPGGECALMMVAGDAEVVRMMVAAGADVSQADMGGRSVLMHSMERQQRREEYEMPYGGFDEEEEEEEWSRERASAAAASWGKHLEVVHALLAHGADVRGAPVLLASMQGYLKLRERLACGGFSSDGDPHPVRAAALNGLWAVQREILDAISLPPSGWPADMHADAKGDTALHLACQEGHIDAVRTMVAGGARVDAGNHQGETGLMAASDGWHVGCVGALAGAGASVRLLDQDGCDALWCSQGRLEVVLALVGADEGRREFALERAAELGWDAVAEVLRARAAPGACASGGVGGGGWGVSGQGLKAVVRMVLRAREGGGGDQGASIATIALEVCASLFLSVSLSLARAVSLSLSLSLSRSLPLFLVLALSRSHSLCRSRLITGFSRRSNLERLGQFRSPENSRSEDFSDLKCSIRNSDCTAVEICCSNHYHLQWYFETQIFEAPVHTISGVAKSLQIGFSTDPSRVRSRLFLVQTLPAPHGGLSNDTILPSKGNLPLAIDLRTLCGANLAT